MAGRYFLFSLAIGLAFGLAPTPANRTHFITAAYAGSCEIDDNRSDTVETFAGRCCKGSIKGEMPGSMWSKTVGDVKDNRSKNDDYRTCWKLISRSEYRK